MLRTPKDTEYFRRGAHSVQNRLSWGRMGRSGSGL